MTFQSLLNLYLVLHITGLTIMAGAVLADFSLSARINKYLSTDKRRALILLEASAGLAPLIGAGALLLILTGTGMVVELKSAVTQALWFRVKMPLVVLVVLNGTVVARPPTLRLQLLLFVAIFVLSIFKF